MSNLGTILLRPGNSSKHFYIFSFWGGKVGNAPLNQRGLFQPPLYFHDPWGTLKKDNLFGTYKIIFQYLPIYNIENELIILPYTE